MKLELRSTDHIQQIRQKAQWARKQEDSARERLVQAQEARTFWDPLAVHISAGNAAHVLLLRCHGN